MLRANSVGLSVSSATLAAAIISSLMSTSSAPTRRITEDLSGKVPTTSVRRLSSRFKRSIGLFDQIFDQPRSPQLRADC